VARPLLFTLAIMQLREMFTAGIGGVAATVVDVCLLVLLVKHQTPVELAAFLSAAAGAAVGYTMNKYIAFRDRSRISWQQIARFGCVAVATALLMALAMHVFAVKLHAPVLIAKAICSALVFFGWTYPAQRRFVFRRSYVNA